jgi:hypothetical protein
MPSPAASSRSTSQTYPSTLTATKSPASWAPCKDATLLNKVAPGDRIKAEIVRGNDGAYLENIIVADNPPSKGPAK